MGLVENKALIRRFYAECDAGNLAAMDELVSPDFVDHDPPPIPGLSVGRQGLKVAFEIFWKSTPGTHEVLDQVAEGDLVVTRIRAKGRFAEDMGPIPATGGVWSPPPISREMPEPHPGRCLSGGHTWVCPASEG